MEPNLPPRAPRAPGQSQPPTEPSEPTFQQEPAQPQQPPVYQPYPQQPGYSYPPYGYAQPDQPTPQGYQDPPTQQGQPGYPPQFGYQQPGQPYQPYSQPYTHQPYAQPGQPYQQAYPPLPAYRRATRTTNGMAIASLVFGIIGIQLLAWIFGGVALAQINRTGQSGRGLAIAGIVLGFGWLIVALAAASWMGF